MLDKQTEGGKCGRGASFNHRKDLYHYIVCGRGRVLKVSFTFTSLMQANGRLCIKKVSFLRFGSGEKATKKGAEGAGQPTGGVPPFFLFSVVSLFWFSASR